MIKSVTLAFVATLALISGALAESRRDAAQAVLDACEGNTRCAFARLAVDEYNSRAAKPQRGSVTIRGASTDGRVIKVGVNVSKHFHLRPTRGGRTVSEQLAFDVRNDLCRKRATRRFFKAGGALDCSMYTPDGAPWPRIVIKAC